ncbi:diguanylate cyclase domain-containing protein [Legionella fallonii]|uniref:Diguanylate cyclase with PAS/PAC sensor (Modular protein) n=1 Tax=Legionella fallonii LLAP-10 TaxID=1212491 RepID=A0A098GAQ9_9GAMM|nr:diguanylate cyclase [Legionella fallonii]CEG58570.1 Diguanylate cyclase with PAS/PAC sensor (modular protein) [Legionella fallonii LLAP-10]
MEALRFRKAKLIYSTFFIALVILIVSGVAVIQQLKERSTNVQWIQHSAVVISTIDAMSLNLIEVQRQFQFYVMTYNKKYWSLYGTAITNAKRKLVDLKLLTVDNSMQQGRIKELGTVLNKLIQSNDNKVGHSNKTNWLSRLGQNEKIFAQLNALINTIRAEEISLHNLRIQRYEHTAYINNIEIVGTMILGCLFSTVAFIAIINLAKNNDVQYKRKEQLEQERLLQQETQRLQLEFSLSTTKQGFWNLNLETHKIDRTLLHDQIFGYSSLLPEWTMDKFVAHIHPDDRFMMAQALKESEENNVSLETECRIYRVDDKSLRWISVIGKILQLHGNKHMLGLIRDITERKLMEHLLTESEERWKFALENARHGVWDWYVPEKIIYFSHYWKKMLGYQDDEIKNEQYEFESRIHPDDKEKVLKNLNNHFTQDTDEYVCEARFRCKNGSYKWILERGQVVSRAPDGTVLRAIGTHTDISEFKENESNLKHLAEHDSLTGLINRSLFEDRVEQAILLAKRQKSSLAVLFVDVDEFKQINDLYGHALGDLILRATANRLLSSIRDMDSCARYGGDEFILLMQDVKNEENVIYIAKTILEQFSKKLVLDHQEFSITLSIGIAMYPKDGEEFLIKKADEAMYFAKKHGKNNFKLYTSGLS